MRWNYRVVPGFLLALVSCVFAETQVYVQVPGPWGTDDLNLAVVSQQSGSSDYTLSLGSDGWFSGTYDADINANTTRTFTVSTSDGTYSSNSGNLSALYGYTEVWIVVAADLSVSVYPYNPSSGISSAAALSSSSRGSSVASSSSRSGSSTKIVRFLSPWTSTTPSIVIGADTTKMTAVKDTCGWYQSKVSSSVYDVIFVQTVGAEAYTASGLSTGLQIALDSIWAISDIVWVNTKDASGLPALSSAFPKSLGDCPSRQLAVTLYDWYDGSETSGTYYHADGDTAVNTDFGKHNVNGKCNGLITGLVTNQLGANGLPVRNDVNFPSMCSVANYINRWFIPDTLVVRNNVTYTNATCRDITLVLEDSTGMWLGQMDDEGSTGDKNLGGAFLLDDFKYLDAAGTVSNPHYDYLNGSGGYHNFGFTMKVHAEFTYVEGQYFEFYGDDDVWVYIDSSLVVDIGGVHSREAASVDLDTIGRTTGKKLVPGNMYSFDMFYAERQQDASNFRMRTSMDLHTERSYFATVSVSNGMKDYSIWQRVSMQGLSCDYSTTDTTMLAPSNFVLTGGGLPSAGIDLDTAGVWYGGITINQNMAGFRIDTAAILASRALSAGKYTLTFILQQDPTLSGSVTFVIPKTQYVAPSITFTDAAGNPVSADTATLGEWTNVFYPVYVAAITDTITTKLYLTSSSPSIIFIDGNGNQVTDVTLQSGKAMFYVMGTAAVTGASITVSGASVSNTLVWPDINLADPPVPTVQEAAMFDRNGDGIPDSVYFRFSRALSGDDALDSLKWTYGDSTVHFLSASQAAVSLVNPTTVVVTSAGFTSGQFTGLQGSAYSGAVNAWFTYSASGKATPFNVSGRISDKVGPIVLSATVSNKGSTISVLSVVLSESLDGALNSDSVMQYRFWRAGVLNPTTMRASSAASYGGNYHYDFYFESHQSELPAVGDSLRLAPGVATDLGGARPHEYNPWVRITGDQNVKVTSTGLVNVPANDTAVKQGPTVSPVLADDSASAEDMAAATGSHGELIDFNLSELLKNENALRGDSLPALTADSVVVHYEVYYYTNLGTYVNSADGSIACSDSIFGGDCTTHKGNIFLAWNMHSKKGRLVGTGAYVAHLTLKVTAGSKVIARSKDNSVWGVRRTSSK